MYLNTKILVCFIFMLPLTLSRVELIIFHNTNIFGIFDEISKDDGYCTASLKNQGMCVGGLSRASTVIEKYRRYAKKTTRPLKILYFFTGSIFAGSIWFKLNGSTIAADFMNILKPDAIILGSNEFHYGIDMLVSYINRLKRSIPVVLTNIDISRVPKLKRIQKSAVIRHGKMKIGVVGYITPTELETNRIGKIRFKDEIKSIRDECKKLKRQNVKIVIALGHSSFEMDKTMADRLVAIDVIIGGKGNDLFWNIKDSAPPEREPVVDTYPAIYDYYGYKNVPIARVPGYGKYLGQLNVTFSNAGIMLGFSGSPIFLSNQMPKNRKVEELIRKYRPQINEIAKTPIARTHVFLSGECRSTECSLGNLISDAFVHFVAAKFPSLSWTIAPIGFINGVAIRRSVNASLNKGIVTKMDLLTIMPYDNNITMISINGTTLMDVLEHSASSEDGFLQYSGVHVLYNKMKPAGSRVVSVKLRCGDCKVPKYEPLDQNRMYNIITTFFLKEGGDGYKMLEKAHFNRKIHEDFHDVLIWYVERMEHIYPQEEGRIQFESEVKSSSSSYSINRLHTFVFVNVLLKYMRF